jgi:hypothetical protein
MEGGIDMFKHLGCKVFHKAYHVRYERANVGRVGVSYWYKCSKCGEFHLKYYYLG